MSTRPSAKPVQMAHLTIGYVSILLPADKAMKVAEALQHAVPATKSYERGYTYTVEEEPLNVEFALVSPSQIRMPSGEPYPMPKARAALPPARPRLLR